MTLHLNEVDIGKLEQLQSKVIMTLPVPWAC